MDCSVSVTQLQTALQQVTSVSVKQISLPILSAVLLEATKDKLVLRATNLSVGVEVRVPATVRTEGIVAIEGVVLQRMIQSLRVGKEMTLRVSGNVVEIEAPGMKAQLKTVAADDFPTLPYSASGDKFAIDPQILVEGVKAVAYAAAVSDIKPEIASVYIYGEKEELVFVATDSFRLAEKRINVKGLPTLPAILVPVKNINEVVRIIGTMHGELSCTIAEHQITFENKDFFCVSRVIDGVFPDYGQIIPSDHTTQVVALKQDIQNLLKLTSVFSDTLQKLTITINPAKKECVFVTSNEEIGTQSSELEAALTGDSITASLNQRYLQEGLQTVATDSITMELSPGKPIVVTPVGAKGFLYLIMPMRQ